MLIIEYVELVLQDARAATANCASDDTDAFEIALAEAMERLVPDAKWEEVNYAINRRLLGAAGMW